MAGNTVSRTAHFVLHRSELAAAGAQALADTASEGPGSKRPQALFDVAGPWLGAMVPKRWARRAVTRNTIKRQIYAVGEQFALELGDGAHVVRLRTGFDKKLFPSATSEPLKQAVRAELLDLFGRFARRAAALDGRAGS